MKKRVKILSDSKLDPFIVRLANEILQKQPDIDDADFIKNLESKLSNEKVIAGEGEKVIYEVMCRKHGFLGRTRHKGAAELIKQRHIEKVLYPFHSRLVIIDKDFI